MNGNFSKQVGIRDQPEVVQAQVQLRLWQEVQLSEKYYKQEGEEAK